jgi:hypothetical protein
MAFRRTDAARAFAGLPHRNTRFITCGLLSVTGDHGATLVEVEQKGTDSARDLLPTGKFVDCFSRLHGEESPP